jgi:excisionase family DNA binding protein
MTKFLNVQELAGHLGISVWSVYSWLHQGLIPKVPGLGRTVRFDPDEIDRWLKGGGIGEARKKAAGRRNDMKPQDTV